MILSGTSICFTGFSSTVRKDKATLIEKMGGVFSAELNNAITHLIAETCDPRSEKYQAARRSKIPVLSVEWIDDAWQNFISDRLVDMNSQEILKKFRLPMFKGCTISLSGFSAAERYNIGLLIGLNGGEYTADMNKSTCTHLIAETNSGTKFKKAVEWGNVRIVDVKWLTKSIEMGYRLPEEKFTRLEPPPTLTSSTRIKRSSTSTKT